MANPGYSEEEAAPEMEMESDAGAPASEGDLSFSVQDYPELEGLKNGDSVEIKCKAHVNSADPDQVSFSIDPNTCEFQTAGPADKAMKEMSHQEPVTAGNENNGVGEDF